MCANLASQARATRTQHRRQAAQFSMGIKNPDVLCSSENHGPGIRNLPAASTFLISKMPLPGVLSDLFSGPEYSVLLCGLDGAGKTTLLYDWHNGDGGATPGGFCSLNVATVGFGGRGKVTFRDLKSHGADAGESHPFRIEVRAVV